MVSAGFRRRGCAGVPSSWPVVRCRDCCCGTTKVSGVGPRRRRTRGKPGRWRPRSAYGRRSTRAPHRRRARAWLQVAAGRGLRVSPEDVDFARGVLRIRRQVQLLGGRLYFTLPKGGGAVRSPTRRRRSSRLSSPRRTATPFARTSSTQRCGSRPWQPPASSPCDRRANSGRRRARTASTCFGTRTPRSSWKRANPGGRRQGARGHRRSAQPACASAASRPRVNARDRRRPRASERGSFSPDSPQRPRKRRRSPRSGPQPLPGKPPGVITQSQSFRLKMTYKLVHTTAIRMIAKGYPSTQCNSGIRSKFIP